MVLAGCSDILSFVRTCLDGFITLSTGVDVFIDVVVGNTSQHIFVCVTDDLDHLHRHVFTMQHCAVRRSQLHTASTVVSGPAGSCAEFPLCITCWPLLSSSAIGRCN